MGCVLLNPLTIRFCHPVVSIVLGVPPANKDGAYVASNPAVFADPSDENVTYSFPLGDVTDMRPLEPVMVSTSGANDDVP